MKKLLIVICVALIASPAFAIDLDNLKLGGQVRMRQYSLENMWNFNDEAEWDSWDVFRLKTSLTASVDVGDKVTGLIRLTNQTYGEGISDAGDNISNKVFVDNAFIKVNELAGLPLALTIGRQNLMYGSGFVLFDGQSQFASTSLYFDGVKAALAVNENMTLDFLYFKDQENSRDEASDDDVSLNGLYFTMNNVLPGKQEAYILGRVDDALDKDIITFGVRASNKMKMGLDYSAEVALQTGDYTWDPAREEYVDQDALGYKLDVGYTVANAAVKPRFNLGYAHLSGDDPDTMDNEGWDVMYGGWPQFGDLLAWMYVAAPPLPRGMEGVSTGGEAAYVNFDMVTLGASLALTPRLSANGSIGMLTFDQVTAGMDDSMGNYYQLTVSYRYNKALGFKIYAAMFAPDDGIGTDLDNAHEIFWEADLRF